MTRDERESELWNWLRSNTEKHKLVKAYMEAAGIPAGRQPQPGTPMSDMIRAILDKEFPPAAAT